MEGAPKTKIENIKNKEGAERPPRYRTVSREILESVEGGLVKTERVIECNGTNHRMCVDKISYGSEGEVLFAEQLSKEDLGRCDGSHFAR